MQYPRIVLFLFSALIVISCTENEITSLPYGNIAANGFNLGDSDAKAVAIADEVMKAMGGRKAWDDTRYLKWNFFGSRIHIWDKKTGDLIIQGIRDTFDIKMNLLDSTGVINYKGIQLSEQDSLQKYIEMGSSMWINDSYWLFMPHKLKDSGVTLKYVAKDTTQDGRSADVLSLTFDNVGDTPNNMYYAYVDDSTRLVSQWDFYTLAIDSIPRFQTPWKDYKLYSGLLLSSSRGENYTIRDISASDTLARYFQ